MVFRQAAKQLLPGLERDLSKAMHSTRRMKFVNVKQQSYAFETPALTDGPLGKSIQAASPVRSNTSSLPKGLFQ
jgi:protein-L-isoaspartate O-methyltransferase